MDAQRLKSAGLFREQCFTCFCTSWRHVQIKEDDAGKMGGDLGRKVPELHVQIAGLDHFKVLRFHLRTNLFQAHNDVM